MNDHQIEVLKGLINFMEEHSEKTILGLSYKDYSISFWRQYPEALKMEVEISGFLGTIYKKSIDRSEFGFTEVKIFIPSIRNKDQVTVDLFK